MPAYTPSNLSPERNLAQMQAGGTLKVAIIGGGFSGVATAIQLLRRSHPGRLEVFLIEKSSRIGGGLAYGSDRGTDLLNVPAEKMSVLPNEPEHFVNWLRRTTRLNPREEVHFAPRFQYRNYLTDSLDEAASRWPTRNHLHRIENEVIDLQRNVDPESWTLTLADQSELSADVVVLAVGWQGHRKLPQFTPGIENAEGFINQSWRTQALRQVDPDQRVLIVGTGLSMFDTVLDLEARSHRGQVLAISRRGLMPHPHAPNGRHHFSPDLAEWLTTPETGRLPRKLRRLREELRTLRNRNLNWRALVAALRPLSPQIWQSWSVAEKFRFQQHYATLWDIHRHRCPPQTWSRVQAWIDVGRLEVLAARIQSIQRVPAGFEVRWLPRGAPKTAEYKATFQVIVNCLGPSSELGSSQQPLIRQLFKRGTIAPDSSSIGIDCTENLQVISRRGNPLRALYIVGPLLRGRFGEATAVPELRQHASLAASQIAKLAQQLSTGSKVPSLAESQP